MKGAGLDSTYLWFKTFKLKIWHKSEQCKAACIQSEKEIMLKLDLLVRIQPDLKSLKPDFYNVSAARKCQRFFLFIL